MPPLDNGTMKKTLDNPRVNQIGTLQSGISKVKGFYDCADIIISEDIDDDDVQQEPGIWA